MEKDGNPKKRKIGRWLILWYYLWVPVTSAHNYPKECVFTRKKVALEIRDHVSLERNKGEAARDLES